MGARVAVDDYSKIFDQRAGEYHQAMTEAPNARENEFQALVERAQLAPELSLLDVPSGGGYLGRYTPEGVRITHVETSRAFHSRAPQAHSVLCDDIGNMPFEDGSVDRVLSLVGLHHIEDRSPFYRESQRILRNGGKLVIAEVETESPVARFLNGFVHDHSTMGHEGLFFSDSENGLIESSGLRVELREKVDYTWKFDSQLSMARFCILLFGIDKVPTEDVLAGIQDILGFEDSGDVVQLNWGLTFVRAVAP